MQIPAMIYDNTISWAYPAFLSYQPTIYEYWKDINLENILPDYYQVSTFGRVRRKKDNYLIKISRHNNTANDYMVVRLSTIDHNYKHFLVHRLVMLVFLRELMTEEQYFVNHIDGVPYHNYLWNLEWCNRSYNMIHAYENNLCPRGENRYNSKLSDKNVERICELLDLGWLYKDILNDIGMEITDNNLDLVGNVKRGITHKHISNKYNFSRNNK